VRGGGKGEPSGGAGRGGCGPTNTISGRSPTDRGSLRGEHMARIGARVCPVDASGVGTDEDGADHEKDCTRSIARAGSCIQIDRGERALFFISCGTARLHMMPVGRAPHLSRALELARTAVCRAVGVLVSLNYKKTHSERRGVFPDDCGNRFHL